MSVVVIGCNHRSTPLASLERMTVATPDLPKALHELGRADHLSEVVVLSTCNRMEVYAFAERFHGGYADIREFLAQHSGLPTDEVGDQLYAFHEDDAVRHLFTVAAGLDSAVIGEHEILGQVRTAWEVAREEGLIGSSLGPLFRHAIETGKRARTETGISRGIASVSQAAVALARTELGGLEGRSVLVLGAGDVAEGTLKALTRAGAADVAIANRTWERARALAAACGGRAVPLDEIGSVLDRIDLLVTTTGAQELMVENGTVDAVLDQRDGRELLIVDIAVPRDVDPAAGELPGVTLLDMDDVGAFVESGRSGRQTEVSRARQIVDVEVDRHRAMTSAREVAPLVAALRQAAEAQRRTELERYAARLAGLDAGQREVVEALTKGIVNKLLHEPTVRLKDAAGHARGDRLAEALRDLFDL